MICLAVFETNPARRDTIKQWLVRYSIVHNCELELLWFVEKAPAERL